MAHSKQALKRVRQNERDRLANKAKMTRMKTEMKKLMTAVEAGDKGKAQALLSSVRQLIDKAAKRSIIHRPPTALTRAQPQAAREARPPPSSSPVMCAYTRTLPQRAPTPRCFCSLFFYAPVTLLA